MILHNVLADDENRSPEYYAIHLDEDDALGLEHHSAG